MSVKMADQIMRLCAERIRLKAVSVELANALEHCRALLLTYEINHANGEEISDAALNTVSEALTKYQGATA
jgi:hypothetical protein